MSVVGIDLGAQSTKIGVARNKGIDIVRVASPRPFFFFLPLSFFFFFFSSHFNSRASERICADFFSFHFRSPMKFPTDLLRT